MALLYRSAILSMSVVCAMSLASGPSYAQFKPDTSEEAEKSITIAAEPIASFEKSGGQQTKFGALEWRGGLVLTSQDSSFGGWSGLAIDPDGKALLAISDAGSWMTTELVEKDGRPVALKPGVIGPLKGRGDKPLLKARDRDSEGVVLLDGDLRKGTLLVAFEQHDRITRMPVNDGKPRGPVMQLKMPPEARKMRGNGFEAVTVMKGGPYKGSVVAIAEDVQRSAKDHWGWIWINGEPKRFTLAGLGDYGVTEAVSLSDGTLLVLQRRFTWVDGVKMRLHRIAPGDLKAGSVVRGEALIDVDMSYQIDNMEGMAVRELPDGTAIITMISDDNFNHLLQRTVLLQFAWKRNVTK